jgi:hypothetical protein
MVEIAPEGGVAAALTGPALLDAAAYEALTGH